MTQKPEQNRIPEFTSREEEAEWFDTHDLGDYLDEFEVLDRKDVRVAKQLSENITVRLTPELLNRLRNEAERKGVGPSTLARMWIMEHLHDQGENHTGRP
jgi:predicted DNA binding CopG/RHH family protein